MPAKGSGRRAALEQLLRDASMSAELSIEVCHRAKRAHAEEGRLIDGALQMAEDMRTRVSDALVEHRRVRTIRLAPEHVTHDLREAA